MNKLKAVSGDSVTFTGYGGQWMKKEGFQATVDLDINQFCDKTFTTYRKTKVHNETIFFRWNPFNLINKHFTRQTDHMYDQVSLPSSVDDGRRAAQEDLPVATLSHPQH